MPYECDFTCLACNQEFSVEWLFGDNVTCSHCKAEMETDWEDMEDGWVGPWVTTVIKKKETKE